jgi:hypothetical protein
MLYGSRSGRAFCVPTPPLWRRSHWFRRCWAIGAGTDDQPGSVFGAVAGNRPATDTVKHELTTSHDQDAAHDMAYAAEGPSDADNACIGENVETHASPEIPNIRGTPKTQREAA